MTFHAFEIPGKPVPQGSMTLMKVGGHCAGKYSNRTIEHRNNMADLMRREWAGKDPLRGTLVVNLLFDMPRPKSHYRTGKHADQLKAAAPTDHTQTPDIDKLTRLVLDSLQVAGVINDDAQVAYLWASKQWQRDGKTIITVTDQEHMESRTEWLGR